MDIIPDKIPFVQNIPSSWYHHKVERVDILRLDVLHHHVSGNKWYKLKWNIEHALANDKDTVLTFGGAYSNHLAATAAMMNIAGLRSVGMVKGLYARDKLTPTLNFCLEQGMELKFLSNEEYSKKDDRQWLAVLQEQHPACYIVPEGGGNHLGLKGAEEIASLIPSGYTHIAVSVGTGTTLAGISNGLGHSANMLGFAPMKGGRYMEAIIKEHVTGTQHIEIVDEYHFGGFGKTTDILINFMNDFYALTTIPLDIVYTGKMMYGIMDRIQSGYFDAGSRILCIHTGGLQGNGSVENRLIY